MTRPDAPPLSVGDTVRVGSEVRTIAAPPVWVRDRWRVLTRFEAHPLEFVEQYVDCDRVVAGGER